MVINLLKPEETSPLFFSLKKRIHLFARYFYPNKQFQYICKVMCMPTHLFPDLFFCSQHILNVHCTWTCMLKTSGQPERLKQYINNAADYPIHLVIRSDIIFTSPNRMTIHSLRTTSLQQLCNDKLYLFEYIYWFLQSCNRC